LITIFNIIVSILWILFSLLLTVLWLIAVQRSKRDVSEGFGNITSLSQPFHLDFVDNIGMSIAPGRKKGRWYRDLEEDLNRISQHYGITTIVTLLEERDMEDIQTPELLKMIESNSMESVHFPVRDKWIPSSMIELVSLVEKINERLSNGKKDFDTL